MAIGSQVEGYSEVAEFADQDLAAETTDRKAEVSLLSELAERTVVQLLGWSAQKLSVAEF